MKKKVFALLLAGIMITAAAGCGKNGTGQPGASAEASSAAGESSAAVYSNDYVDLGNYRNLSATKTVYTVTQDSVDEEVRRTLSEYADYEEVDRAAKEGDYVTIKFTGSVDGEVVMNDFAEEAYEIILGDAEYGEEFDQKIVGAKPGASLDFSVAYTAETANDDNGLTEFAGKTVDYHVDVASISEEILPKYTDAFVKENIDGFSTIKDFEADLKQDLEASSAEASESELQEALLQQVINVSELKDYPEELYQTYYESTLENYRSFAEAFGQSTEEADIMEMFGLTEESLKEEAMEYLFQSLVITAIAEKENISVSDDEFDAAAGEYAADYEYEDTASFLADYGEDNVRSWVLEDKVLDFLEENADITETEAVYTGEE